MDFWSSFYASRAAHASERVAAALEAEAVRSRAAEAREHEFRYSTDPVYRRWWDQREERLALEAADRFRRKVLVRGGLVVAVVFLLLPLALKLLVVGLVGGVIAYRLWRRGSFSDVEWGRPHTAVAGLLGAAVVVWAVVAVAG